MIGTAIWLYTISFKFFREVFPGFIHGFAFSFFLSVLLTLPLFVKEWRKLRKEEEEDETNDPHHPMYVGAGLTASFFGGFIFLVAVSILLSLYTSTKTSTIICFSLFLILVAMNYFYNKKVIAVI
jgi:hypothetical protein